MEKVYLYCLTYDSESFKIDFLTLFLYFCYYYYFLTFILYDKTQCLYEIKNVYYSLPQGKYRHNHVLKAQESQFCGNCISMKKIISI